MSSRTVQDYDDFIKSHVCEKLNLWLLNKNACSGLVGDKRPHCPLAVC